MEIASVMAGLDDEPGSTGPVGKSEISQLFANLSKQIADVANMLENVQERRAPAAKFQTGGVEGIDTAKCELTEALANGKPLGWRETI